MDWDEGLGQSGVTSQASVALCSNYLISSSLRLYIARQGLLPDLYIS